MNVTVTRDLTTRHRSWLKERILHVNQCMCGMPGYHKQRKRVKPPSKPAATQRWKMGFLTSKCEGIALCSLKPCGSKLDFLSYHEPCNCGSGNLQLHLRITDHSFTKLSKLNGSKMASGKPGMTQLSDKSLLCESLKSQFTHCLKSQCVLWFQTQIYTSKLPTKYCNTTWPSKLWGMNSNITSVLRKLS